MALTLEKALNILINSIALYSSVWEYLSQIIVAISIVYWRHMIDDFSLVTNRLWEGSAADAGYLAGICLCDQQNTKIPSKTLFGSPWYQGVCVQISGSWPKREIVLKGHLWERKRCLPAPGFSRPLIVTNILT